MTGIVADHNVEGHLHGLVRVIARSDLADFWTGLRLRVLGFADLGWPPDLPDREVWHRCQTDGLVLFTNNRNDESDTSLERTIRDALRPDSLPVLTVTRLDRLAHEPGYADRLAADLVEVLFDIRDSGRWLGVGRLFLPFA